MCIQVLQQGIKVENVRKGLQHMLQEVRLRSTWISGNEDTCPMLCQHDHPRG
ncbi:hypothetical protein NC651_040254 [Populus alba x Populus x berolinensis]|nr:hypothetical protein NC651_040254 [Populus alba x Populus x berolinensis]